MRTDTNMIDERVAEVFLEGGAPPLRLAFDQVELDCSAPAKWLRAQWIFRSRGGERRLPCASVVEVNRGDDAPPFPVIVRHPDGRAEELVATGIVAAVPDGAHCLVYVPRFDGAWRGKAVTVAFGRIIVRDHDYDPA